jgi:hypothetical protein
MNITERLHIFNLLLFFIVILFSSCITDVIIDDSTTKKDSKEIEDIISNVNLTNYPSLPKTTEIPIVAWHGIQEGHLNSYRFKEAKNAGINLNYTHHTHVDSVEKSLNIAKDLGMKILIYCPELESDTKKTILRFKEHPANGGYFIKDEPTASLIPRYKKLVNIIESIDSTHFCYINLFSNQYSASTLESNDYRDYVSRYVNEMPLKFLSFDHYPIMGNFISPIWYQNLEIIKDIADNNRIPFWAFALTTSHSGYPIPNMNHLRLQTYSNLLYGAKGIQYFTYWTLKSKRWDFNSGPIDENGNKTKVYNCIQKMNNEICNLSSIFLSCKVVKISHFGILPIGTAEFDKPPFFIKSINIKGGNALMSELKNDDDYYFIVQNTNKEIEINFSSDTETSIVLKNGKIVPAYIINNKFKLIPGDIAIFSH